MNPQNDRPGQQPAYGINSSPQRAASGHYEVVPPPNITGTPTGHNPYEFIVAANAPKKQFRIPGANSFLGKILYLVGGLVLLLVVAGTIISAVFSSANAVPELTATAQAQQELIRISGKASPVSQTTEDLATNVYYSITTSQQSLLKYMSGRGIRPKPIELALGRSTQADTLLETAKTSNTYDTALLQVLSDDLTAYQAKLQATFNKTNNSTLRADLQQYFAASKLLLEQLKTAQSATAAPVS